MTETSTWLLRVVSPAGSGIVAQVAGAIAAGGGDITEMHQYTSHRTGRFFVRARVTSPESAAEFAEHFHPVGSALQAEWSVHEVGRRMRTLLLASKSGHCLNDLLFRQRTGYLPIDVPLVMSNHADLAPLASFYDVPYEHHEVTSPGTKQAFEDRLRAVVAEHDVELVVLARYMQILSPELCAELAGRIINIHHSFLPGFKGANPYRQAWERGVKLIGATAHFVTDDLDEGPIIEQDVARVDHALEVAQFVALGQDQEARTLREAVKLFAERRVFIDGLRTVVFR